MSEWILPAWLGWEVEGILYRSHPEANNAVNRIKKATGKRPPMRPPRELPEGWVIVGVGAWAGWPIPRALLDATGNVLTGLQPYVDRGGLLPELASASASPASAAPGVTASASPASAAPGVTASASPASAADAERMTAVLDLRRREVEAAERQAAAFERIAGLLEARLQAPAVSEAAAAAPEVSSSHAEGPEGSAS